MDALTEQNMPKTKLSGLGRTEFHNAQRCQWGTMDHNGASPNELDATSHAR